MVVIARQLNVQLSVQSVSITTHVVELGSRLWRGLLDTTICDKVCQ